MKRRIWFRVALGIAVAVAIVLGVMIDLKRKASAILKRHEEATLAKVAEFRGRSWPRVVLFGQAAAGNRWDDFTKALDAFDAIPQADLDELPGFQDSDPDWKPDPEKIDAVLARHQGCVDQLRAACRKDTLRPAYAYEQGYNMDLPYISKAMSASRYLAAAAERAHELGRDREAADHAVLALSVGQDTGVGGPVINRLVEFACEQHAIRAMRKIVAGHALSAGELQELGTTLDRLWASRPRQLESFEIEDSTSRLGLVMALNEYEIFFAEAARLDPLRGPELLEAAQALERKTKRSRNPIVAGAIPALARGFRRDAITGMNWNLMRTSVALAAYEKEHGAWPAKLEDLVPRYLPRIANCPMSGQPVRLAPGKVWAFGGDGDDDGGRPMVDEDREDDDGDVVWTVRRK